LPAIPVAGADVTCEAIAGGYRVTVKMKDKKKGDRATDVPAHKDGNNWPEKLQFKVEMYTESKSYSAPWSIEHITLPSVK
jgi:hypothetical protein